MVNVYNFLEYRPWLKEAALVWKKSKTGRTLNALAVKAEIHPPFFSNLIKEKVHLNTDQLFNICKALGVTSEEASYAEMLLDWERSTLEERKQILKQNIDQIRKDKLSSESHLKMEKIQLTTENQASLFLKPELYIIYFFLSIPRFADDLSLVAESLQMEAERVESAVKELIGLGFIELVGTKLVKTKKHFHLPKESPLCEPHQVLLKYRALQHQQASATDKQYSFMVTFTADPEVRAKIHREFLSFLSRIETWVKEAPSEEVYQMNFDLFPWS